MPDKSEFFKEVEFSVESFGGDSNKPATRVYWDKAKLDKAYEDIKTELRRIKGGTSDYSPRAVDPGTFGFPADNAIRIFIDNPTDKGFKDLQGITVQDFGKKASVYFLGLLKVAKEVIPNV